ncbi:MAG: hypothetical protein AMXMBFR64_51070 [Myxococcales bacterium]
MNLVHIVAHDAGRQLTGHRARLVAALLAALLGACGASPSDEAIPDGSLGGDSSDPVDGHTGVDAHDAGPGIGPVQDPVAITGIVPAKGKTDGSEPVTIVGRGFTEPVQVWIGDEEALSPVMLNPTLVSILTPPGTAGRKDVRLLNGDGEELVVPEGFLYYDVFGVDAVTPAEGPVAGATALTIKGYGFLPESMVMLGDRVAIQTKVVDPETILCISPLAEAPGKVDVRVTTPAGVALLERGFRYTADLGVTAVTPPAGFTTGGETITIHGAGFDAPAEATSVFLGASEAEIVSVSDDGTRVEAITPAHAPGQVDVTVALEGREATLWDSFTFVDQQALDGPTKILSISPKQGPQVGGTPVSIVANGLTSVTDAKVRFGQKGATVTAIDPDHGVLEVLSPAALAPSVVDLELTTALGTDVAPAAFTYLAIPSLSGASPASGPAAGGTPVTLTGTSLAGVDGVWFDALPATALKVVDDKTLTVTTPPGSPGPVTVRVRSGPLESKLKGAFVYEAGKVQLLAVDPDGGPMGGGTVVNLYGTDLPKDARVFFGLDESLSVEWLSPAVLRTSSVGVEVPTTVDVVLKDKEGLPLSDLPNAYTYYNPASAHGGTWGPPVTGTLNVTVMDLFRQEGVQGAYVILGSDPSTPYQGYTDWLGQITFNGPDLQGGQSASAWHPEYSGSSIIEFDAENVTILLFPKIPPSSGGGGGGGLNLPGVVSGHVSVYEKYLIPPPGTCEGKKDPGGVLCKPCTADVECGEQNRCTAMLNGQSYCTTPCGAGGDCPSGWACMAPALGEDKRCMPVAGQTRIVCGTTMSDVLTPTPDPGVGKVADINGNFTIQTRTGPLVVVCRAELYDEKTGSSVSLSMGASQSFFVEPAEHVDGIEVSLDVPTNRDVLVQMDYPPSKLMALPLHRLRTLLDFGEAGVLELHRSEITPGDGSLTLSRLPKTLNGSLTGVSYLVIGGAFSNTSWTDWWNPSAIPLSATIQRELPDLAARNLYVPEGDGWKEDPSGVGPVLAVWAVSPDDIYAVGRDGLIVRRQGGTWGLQGGPVKTAWLDVWARSATEVWAVGVSGALIRSDGFAWKQVAAVGFVPTAIAGTPAGLLIVGEGGQAAEWTGEQLEPRATGTIAPLRGAWTSPSGTVWVVGDGGTVLYYTNGIFSPIDGSSAFDLRAVGGSSDTDLVLVGSFGAVKRFDGVTTQTIASGTTENLHGVWVAADGSSAVAVGNRGTILHIDGTKATAASLPGSGARLRDVCGVGSAPLLIGGEDAHLFGPLMELPNFEGPIALGSLVDRTIAWTTPGGALPDFNYVQLGAQWWFPIWNMITDGPVQSVQVPDFQTIFGQTNFKGANVYLQVDRIRAAGFDIDSFEFYIAFFPFLWDSWSINSAYVNITGAGFGN